MKKLVLLLLIFCLGYYVHSQQKQTSLFKNVTCTKQQCSYDVCWKYDLPKEKHSVKFKISNPSNEHEIRFPDVIIYSDKPVNALAVNKK